MRLPWGLMIKLGAGGSSRPTDPNSMVMLDHLPPHPRVLVLQKAMVFPDTNIARKPLGKFVGLGGDFEVHYIGDQR